MDDAKGGKIAVLRAERAVDDIDVIHQFRAEGFQPAEIALSVGLRRLILRNVIDQNFEASVEAAVIEVEAESAKLKRLATTLVLPGVDAAIERFDQLIVA